MPTPEQNGTTNQLPDLHVAYGSLDEASRQRFEALDANIAHLVGATARGATEGVFADIKHPRNVAYDALDGATRQRVEAADDELSRLFKK